MCREFHAEPPHAIVSEGLAQGPYMAARAGLEPTILWTIGVDSINGGPRPTNLPLIMQLKYGKRQILHSG